MDGIVEELQSVLLARLLSDPDRSLAGAQRLVEQPTAKNDADDQ